MVDWQRVREQWYETHMENQRSGPGFIAGVVERTRLAEGESCRGAEESAENLYRLDIRLTDELKTAAQTAEQKKIAEHFASSVDYLLVGHTKPTTKDHRGLTINVSSSDNYGKQELLK